MLVLKIIMQTVVRTSNLETIQLSSFGTLKTIQVILCMEANAVIQRGAFSCHPNLREFQSAQENLEDHTN